MWTARLTSSFAPAPDAPAPLSPVALGLVCVSLRGRERPPLGR